MTVRGAGAGTVGGAASALTDGSGVTVVTVSGVNGPEGTGRGAGAWDVATGGTADDGTYELAGLLPGDYKLRFTAAGFDETWYPGVPTPDLASPLELEPHGALDHLEERAARLADAPQQAIVQPFAQWF